MALPHGTPLIDRLFAAASHLRHLNKPVPHLLMDVHDAMTPLVEKLQSTLQDRGWAPVTLPPFLSTLQARLVITGLVIAFGVSLFAAALPRLGKGKNVRTEAASEEKAELKESVMEEEVGEAGVEEQESRSEVEVEVVQTEERVEADVDAEAKPVSASPKTVSIAAEVESPAAPAANPASPPSEPTTASPVPAPVSKKETRNSVDPRSSRPEPTRSYRTSPVRTRSSTSSIPVRVPTTPARASSYPIALNTKNVTTPARKTTSPTASPASAKVVAASYAWVMSEGLEWDDGGSGSETEGNSYNSGSHSDDDDKDNSSPRSRKSLEDELTAAGYTAGELDGGNDDDSASEDENENKHDAAAKNAEKNGALHPRRHSHTSDIEARYEEWRKTRASQHAHGNNHHQQQQQQQQKSTTSSPTVGGLVGGMRKTRSHHSRKDSVLETPSNSPSTGRSSLSMTKSVGSVTRQALQRKRSSALKPWARKRKEDFGEWLKRKTTAKE